MDKETAEKKKKYHLNRYNFYKKKEKEADIEENRIGFKLKRDQ